MAAAPAPAALKVLRRADYAPVAWTTRRVALDFDIREGATRVRATLRFERNAAAQPVDGGAVSLNRGHDVELVSIALDGAPLTHELTDKALAFEVPAAARAAGAFELVVETRIVPEKNTALEGLYRSTGTYCTQCEAEGFRSITFFQDRPDVMAVWRVRVEADRAACPVLLSNGNLVEQGAAAEAGRHFAVYEDPWPKPCYLFALVAGDLAETRDAFRTRSGRDVSLRIYTAARDAGKTGWAMESLKRAMKWDEDTFGLEYDLDLFNIVAVPDFNMGEFRNATLREVARAFAYLPAARRPPPHAPRRRHGEQEPQRLQQPPCAREHAHGLGPRLQPHRGRRGARVLPHLDGRPRYLQGLVPAHAQGGPDGFPRPELHGGRQLAAHQAHRGRAHAAHAPVCRGRRPDGAPDPPGRGGQDG